MRSRASTTSSRLFIFSTSFSGNTVQRLSRRAPIAVFVQSRMSISDFPSGFIVLSSSSERIVNGSMWTNLSSSMRDIVVMCPSCVCCVISRYCSTTPAATTPALICSTPYPFRFLTLNSFSTLSRAVVSLKAQSSSLNVANLLLNDVRNIDSRPFSYSTSFGWKSDSSRFTYSMFPSLIMNSPVDISRKLTPQTPFPKCTAARKLFSRPSSTVSCMATPGVTSSVIPLFTRVFVSFGSSSWSQMATRRPARTSFGRYVSRA